MQGTGKSAAAGPELGDSIVMIGRVVLGVLLLLLTWGTGGTWEKISALPGEQGCPLTPLSSWVMLRSFPAPPVLYPFPRVGLDNLSPINTSKSLSFAQFSLLSLQEFNRELPQGNTQTGFDFTDAWLEHSPST